MTKKLDLTSRVRQGMAVERKSAVARLEEKDVAATAHREASGLVGANGHPVAAVTGSRLKVRLTDVASNPYNPRAFYNPETIDTLRKSFDEQGQLEPIKVTKLGRFPDKYVIIDGERRVRAAKSRGDDYIDAEFVDEELETKALYLRAYRANKERDEQTVFDDSVAWKLLDEGVYQDYRELAIAVGEAPAQVNKIIHLTSLPVSFIEKMAHHSKAIGLAHAYNLKLIFDRAGQRVAEHWLNEVVEGRASVRKLEQVSSADAPTRRPGSRRTHYQSRVQFKRRDGVSLGELKLFGDGRTELSLQGVQGDDQQRLAERMKKLIEEWSSELSDAALTLEERTGTESEQT
ncbi:ParB/RepB/Spo0J family partition protein [Paraburkholderia kirstenboschensis]|uniref:ParB/RepB/Spo0J family partition protein n=1 Tax=Paraburkholderia kirstenboschensis TaxID=1245436 RepID=UPI000A77CAD9|nr:ParB/RepB/Spo0J family partition protein [Paraburkholderia kirstenboschensis]